MALILARPRGAALANPGALLTDPEVREALVKRLIEGTPSGFDSHPDPDVGYVLLAGKGTSRTLEHDVDASPLGMRERPYALPKPADTVRVVLLGDSYVFGWGVEAEERLGAQLETLLRERAPAFAGEVECLHLAVPSWNIIAECAWLLRQLEQLRPDLVVQFTAENDLDDNAGVRGFGAMASFSPAHHPRADARIHSGAPRSLGFINSNLLACGLDYESRSRLDEAAAWIARLRSAVVEQGGEYVLVANWDALNRVLVQRWGELLPPSRFVFLPDSFVGDQELRVSFNDRHWSAAGHRELARILLGLMLGEDLLPVLDLGRDPALEDEAAAFFDQGRRDAQRGAAEGFSDLVAGLLTALDFEAIDVTQAVQVHGGIDRESRVSPYASVLLRRGEGTHLVLEGESLSQLALRGARVAIFADELLLGTLQLGAVEPLVTDLPLPEEALARSILSIRLQSSDYVYAGDDLRRCVSFRLKRVALVP